MNLTARMQIADAKLEDAIADVHPVTLFLFCILNPKFIKYIPRRQPSPELLYTSP